ncbi:MAG: maleylacetoacetate isomerase [Pseudomonadota bacterium]
MKLYSYWRSSAAYRVRIALNLKGLDYEIETVDLVSGAHKAKEYRAINVQTLVPSLDCDGQVIHQSLTILEYLEEKFPQHPLLPDDREEKATVRALAQMVACDIHPLNNLRVLKYLVGPLEVSHDAKAQWYKHWVAEGFHAVEARLEQTAGKYCVGDGITHADVCLVPQVYNARRFDCDLGPYPNIVRIEQDCLTLRAFNTAVPEKQPDAP